MSEVEKIAEIREKVKQAIAELSPASELEEVAFKYLKETQGKLFRPILSLAIYSDFGGTLNNDVIVSSVGLEMIHVGSLIIDDIQDKGETRRDQPCLYKQIGLEQAINPGVALMVYGGKLMHYKNKDSYFDLVGSMWSGQYLDLKKSDLALDAYMKIAEEKTGALFSLSLLNGIYFQNEDYSDTLNFAYKFGLGLGRLFQMCDDYLDFSLENKKGFAKDLVNGAPNYVLFKAKELGLELDSEKVLLFKVDHNPDYILEKLAGALANAKADILQLHGELLVDLDSIGSFPLVKYLQQQIVEQVK